MKSLMMAVTLLLAQAVPTHAAKANPTDFPLFDDYRDMVWVCNRGLLPEDLPGQDMEELHPARTRVCTMADKLGRKIEAKGYCTLDHGWVGRPSRNRKHCYAIDNYIPVTR